MNRVILSGNVGSDPKVKEFADGGKMASFTLATNEYRPGKDGEQGTTVTEWHNIVVMRSGMAGVIEEHVKKGTALLVEGKLRTRKWDDKDGQTHYTTEVLATDMEFIGTKKKEDAERPAERPAGKPAESKPEYKDDLPF